MIKQYTTLIIDMYGVILKESRGSFIPYVFSNFDKSEHERLDKLFNEERIYDKAQFGEIDGNELMKILGFENPKSAIKDYIENHLTLDEGFINFAEKACGKYELILLSNDVSDFSEYICEYYELNKYFKHKIVSASVKCRKPELEIFDKALEIIGRTPAECIFVDNRPKNLISAEEVGISPILFNRDESHYYGMSVDNFDELSDIISV